MDRVGGPPRVTFDGRVVGPPCVMSSERVGDHRVTYMVGGPRCVVFHSNPV